MDGGTIWVFDVNKLLRFSQSLLLGKNIHGTVLVYFGENHVCNRICSTPSSPTANTHINTYRTVTHTHSHSRTNSHTQAVNDSVLIVKQHQSSSHTNTQ